jgi:hypothetical protein
MELNINNYQEYYTHSNGSRPYKVEIINNSLVRVYKSDICILNMITQQVFIGKSEKNKMTEYSGGQGASQTLFEPQGKAGASQTLFEPQGNEFDGNTILVKMNDTTYVYIGCKIMSFNTQNQIISYHSPVGNNDVPYPYAIDSANNYYLMIENAILKSTQELHNFLSNGEDPYEYYYHASLITEDRGIGRKPLFQNNFNIIRFYIGKELYTMRYSILPSNEFDRFTKELGNNVYIRDKKNVKHNITKQQYIEIMEDFSNTIGASPMINNIFDL